MGMTIRLATLDDLSAVVAHAHQFIATTSYSRFFHTEQDSLERLFRYLLEHPHIVIVAVDGEDLIGGIALHVGPGLFDGQVEAREVGWWVRPEDRKRLVGPRLCVAAEKVAKAAGAVRIMMIAPVGEENIDRYYRARGYSEMETAYTKDLS